MRRRLALYSVICFSLLPSLCRGEQIPEKPDAAKTVARYAAETFIAGCRVLPKPLYEDPHFGSLPIHWHLPEPVSLRRLDGMGVEELAVFCGPASKEKSNVGIHRDLQWAAAARLAKPFKLKDVMTTWQESLVPREEEIPNPEPVRLGRFGCFRVPAGSFFPPPREYGTLRFLDREGRPAEKGVNVGNIYEYRSYVEGDSKAAAIFTLSDINEADLIEGRLPLELRLDVYLTYRVGREFTMAEITLRNPKTGLTSEPIRMEAKSYVNRRLNIPCQLTAIDDGKKREVDLLKDLVSKGQLEVVLKGTKEAIYYGVGEYDLNLRPLAFEYVFVNDREIVVAESAETLEAMLQSSTKPVAMSERLSQPGEIVVTATVRGNNQVNALQQLARTISDHAGVRQCGDTLKELTGTLRLSQPVAGKLSAKFVDQRSASRARRLGQEWVRQLRTEARKTIGDAIDYLAAFANLASLGSDGLSFSFPNDIALTTEEFEAAQEKRKSELVKVVFDALDSVRIESEADILTVEFKRPMSLSNLSKPAMYALAHMDASFARNLFNFEAFDFSDEVFKRVTDRLPREPGAWAFRAWQLAYNVSPMFDGYETRYAWVRRGINVLLDGAEQNPGSTDMLWMAARFIGRKIGDDDNQIAYRDLFSKDKELHRRLAKFVELEKARSPDRKIDNWLTAKLLFEESVRRQEEGGASSAILPALFYSRPAVMQARYAESLARGGHWEASRRAWAEAEKLHKNLARRKALDEKITDRILPSFPADPDKKITVPGRQFIRLDYWLTRCRLEQTKELQLARKLAYGAAQHVKQSKLEKAIEGYRRSLKTLAKLEKQNPDAMSLLYGDLKDIAKGYRDYCRPFDDKSLAPLLRSIEQSESLSTFPLSVDPMRFQSIQDSE